MTTPENLYFLPDEETRVLPDSIRFALAYREAKLGRKDIETLIRNGFLRLGFYLSMKAAGDNDPVQAQLLQTMAAKGFNFGQLALEDFGKALNTLEQEEEPFVHGGKLAQVSRHGFRNWVERFDKKLTDVQEARSPDAPLFMVAESPYIGFDVIAAHSLLRGRPLGILKPERFAQTEQSVGFVLEPDLTGARITPLNYDFARPDGAIIFDDVLNAGKVMKKTIDFWTEKTDDIPDFVTAVRVNSRI